MGTKSERREQRTAAAKARDAAKRVTKALIMAAPIALVLHYEDGLNHCLEMSICATEALARRDITAKVVPCAAVAIHQINQNLRLPVGLTPRQIYDRIVWGDVTPIPYEAWQAQNFSYVSKGELNTHAIVEVCVGNEVELIDLTIGQLRACPVPEAKSIPWQLVLSKRWQNHESRDWIIAYRDPLHSQEDMTPVEAMIKEFRDTALIDNLNELIGVALDCDLNRDRFLAELRQRNPTDFNTAMSRIYAFGGVE